MKSIIRFVKAAGSIGGGSVGLAIVLFVVSIYEHFRDKNIPAYWLLLAAAVFFTFGAYRGWASEHEAFTNEVEKNGKPLLNIELMGCSFDVSKILNKNELQVHVYAYLKVTNLNSPETIIKDGTLVMAVDGNRHRGVGDDNSVKGNAIEHFGEFQVGGEVLTADVFGNTLSPFPRLLSAVREDRSLRRGITQEGFVVFTFANPLDWDRESPYIIPVTDAVFTLRDSFDGMHTVEVMSLKIPEGKLTNSGSFPLTGLFSR